MILIIKTFLFHVVTMMVFITIYYNMPTHFVNSYDKKAKPNIYDYIYFGSSVTCGTGLSPIYANTGESKMLVTFQQMIALAISVIAVYFFAQHHVHHAIHHAIKK
jgi:hypothetical protein